MCLKEKEEKMYTITKGDGRREKIFVSYLLEGIDCNVPRFSFDSPPHSSTTLLPLEWTRLLAEPWPENYVFGKTPRLPSSHCGSDAFSDAFLSWVRARASFTDRCIRIDSGRAGGRRGKKEREKEREREKRVEAKRSEVEVGRIRVTDQRTAWAPRIMEPRSHRERVSPVCARPPAMPTRPDYLVLSTRYQVPDHREPNVATLEATEFAPTLPRPFNKTPYPLTHSRDVLLPG